MPLARNSAALKKRAWLNGPTLAPAYLSMNRFTRSALNQRSGNYVCNCTFVGDGCRTITDLDLQDFANEGDGGVWTFNEDLEVKECERVVFPENVDTIIIPVGITVTVDGEIIFPEGANLVINGTYQNNSTNTTETSGNVTVKGKISGDGIWRFKGGVIEFTEFGEVTSPQRFWITEQVEYFQIDNNFKFGQEGVFPSKNPSIYLDVGKPVIFKFIVSTSAKENVYFNLIRISGFPATNSTIQNNSNNASMFINFTSDYFNDDYYSWGLLEIINEGTNLIEIDSWRGKHNIGGLRNKSTGTINFNFFTFHYFAVLGSVTNEAGGTINLKEEFGGKEVSFVPSPFTNITSTLENNGDLNIKDSNDKLTIFTKFTNAGTITNKGTLEFKGYKNTEQFLNNGTITNEGTFNIIDIPQALLVNNASTTTNLGVMNIENSSYTIFANKTLQNGDSTNTISGTINVNQNGSIFIGNNATDAGSILKNQDGNININYNGRIVLVGTDALFDNETLGIVTNNSQGPTDGAGIGINPGAASGKIVNNGTFNNYGIMEIGSGIVENKFQFENGDDTGQWRGGMKFIDGSRLLNENIFYNKNESIIEIFGDNVAGYSSGIITNNSSFTNSGIIYQGSGDGDCKIGTINGTNTIDNTGGTISLTCI